MKVLMINSVCGIRSTGRICTDLAEILEQNGHTVKIAYGRENVLKQHEKYAVKIGGSLSVKLHALKSRIFDSAGFGSTYATKKFIKWVREYDPDIIHLHNIHGYYLDIRVLMKYLKTSGKKIIWTLHDCWAFTGHCAHFSAVGCNKWKTKCYNCPQKQQYPKSSVLSNAKVNFEVKKKLFSNIPNLTIITPSVWLAQRVKESFLGEYPVYPIHNGIDLTVFKPTNSTLREKFGLEDKKIILGVASAWDKRKGLEDFCLLKKMLPEEYKIVLVGLTAEQISALPNGILGIERTDGVKELAEWYSTADVFVNPSVEETMGLTTAEALACGTPAITYNKTAVPEVIDETCGIVVDCKPELILEALKKLDFKENDCLMRAKFFEKTKRYLEYLEIYDN